MTDSLVVARMQNLIKQWEKVSDQRSIFLSCYCMMTENMLAAVEQGDFKDPIWVEQLLERFAEHYFSALRAYDEDPRSASQVWQTAFKFTRHADGWALQKLLLGVNAHINYDLVLTLDELLKPEWGQLSVDKRAERHRDYCTVNGIIAHTIDAVQDQILEPAMPWMDLLDRLFGGGDERLISGLLTGWRDRVWDYAQRLLETVEPNEQVRVIHQVEADALKLAKVIMMTDPNTWFDEL